MVNATAKLENLPREGNRYLPLVSTTSDFTTIVAPTKLSPRMYRCTSAATRNRLSNVPCSYPFLVWAAKIEYENVRGGGMCAFIARFNPYQLPF